MKTEEKKIVKIRKADERGRGDHGWLNSYHTFSFAGYFDKQYMGFRMLKVINDDTIQPGRGFGTHAHQDMEIISYVIEGALEHKDSLGNGSVIRQGNFQFLSAGTGITHSEFNHSANEPVHFLQIWIQPAKQGLEPSYGEISVRGAAGPDGLVLIASPDGRNKSATVHQDAYLYFGALEKGRFVTHSLLRGRGVWIQMIEGEVKAAGHTLTVGDGLSVENSQRVAIEAGSLSKFLLIDLN